MKKSQFSTNISLCVGNNTRLISTFSHVNPTVLIVIKLASKATAGIVYMVTHKSETTLMLTSLKCLNHYGKKLPKMSK